MRPIKYLAFNGKELVPVISLDSMKDGEPIVLVSEDGCGDLPLKNMGKVPVYQFTGLKDKNGVEIYEGHVVKDSDYVYEVKFGNCDVKEYEGMGWLLSNSQSTFYLSPEDVKAIKIIGHISTNPELLK